MKQIKYSILSVIMCVTLFITSNIYAGNWTDASQQPDSIWFINNPTATDYTLTTPEQLAGLAALVNLHGYSFNEKVIKLGNDISLFRTTTEGDTVLWTPIGSTSAPFMGTFDGGGNAIDSMTINATEVNSGFFGYTDNATIANLIIAADSKINSSAQYLGALVGQAVSTHIENCHNKAAIISTKTSLANVGGIAGLIINNSIISLSSNSGSITGVGNLVGGIAGGCGNANSISTIENCYNVGTISNSGTSGGIVGMLQSPTSNNDGPYSTIVNCYNAGSVTITGNMAGGIAGMVNKNTLVTNCVSYADITSTNRSGGVIGSIAVGAFHLRNYSYGTVTGTTIAADNSTFSEDEIKSQALLDEVTAYAGYLNRTEDRTLLAWTSDNNYPVLATTEAPAAYSVTVSEELANGIVTFSGLAVDNIYYASVGTTIDLTITPDKGFQLAWLKANDEDITSSFTMPAEDVVLTALFEILIPTTWIEVAYEAVLGTDYEITTSDALTTYSVSTARGLAYVASLVNDTLIGEGTLIALANNISLGEKNTRNEQLLWTPIGSAATPFKCTFDGAGHTIDSMLIIGTAQRTAFIGTAENAVIKNVTIGSNSSVTSTATITASLVAYATGTTIENCHNRGTVTTTAATVGGVAGQILGNSYVSLSSNSGAITGGGAMVGGIVGYCGNASTVSSIANCYNTGAISSTATSGGIVGMLQGPTANVDGPNSTVFNCYNAGNVTITGNMAGGIAANLNKYSIVTNCISYADITSTNRSGGIIGSIAADAVVERNYSYGTITGVDLAKDGTTLTEDQLKSQVLLDEVTAYAGYLNRTEDKTLLAWTSDNNYPVLATTEAPAAYSVTISEELANGTIELPLILAVDTIYYAHAASNVALTATPEDGYVLSWIKANDIDVSKETLAFAMPEADVVITALFQEPGSAVEDFEKDNTLVWSDNSIVYVKSAEDTPIAVYSSNGQLVLSDNLIAGTTAEYTLGQGIYLIRVNNNTYKVFVK